MRNLHTWESVQKGPLTERESCRGTSFVALAILSAMTHLDLYRLYRLLLYSSSGAIPLPQLLGTVWNVPYCS